MSEKIVGKGDVGASIKVLRRSMHLQKKPCGDCGVQPGEYHEIGCDVEQCPACGGRLTSGCCICICCQESMPNEERIPWSGVYPGVVECLQFGWYGLPVMGKLGLQPCREDEPSAELDFTRLRLDAVWDQNKKRFVRR